MAYITVDEMAATLRALGWKVNPPIDPTTCRHPRAIGSGSLGPDGSSHSQGYCPDCHKSWDYRTPAHAKLR